MIDFDEVQKYPVGKEKNIQITKNLVVVIKPTEIATYKNARRRVG